MINSRQARLPFKLPQVAAAAPPVDEEKQRALEGLPHYWRMSWGYFDIVIEACGYPAKVSVDRLEDPSYKHHNICPWEGKHTHKPFWDKYPTGWPTRQSAED